MELKKERDYFFWFEIFPFRISENAIDAVIVIGCYWLSDIVIDNNVEMQTVKINKRLRMDECKKNRTNVLTQNK